MKNPPRSILTLIFIVSFSLSYGLERLYDNCRVLDQYNTLFDADSPAYLDGFANGWSQTNFRHPFAGLPFSLPIRAVAKLVHKAAGSDELNVRRNLALLIIPFFQGLKNIFLYLILTWIGLTIWQALILCGLNLFALSTVTIGSIPESFPISSMTTVLFAWFMVCDQRAIFKIPAWLWILAGGFAIGITVTNIVPLAVFHFLGEKYGKVESWRRSILQSAAVSTVSLIFAFVSAVALSIAYSHNPRHLLPNAGEGDLGMRRQQHRPAEELVIAAASTFAGVISANVVPNEHLFQKTFSEADKPSLLIMFTYAKRRLDNAPSLLWALTFAGLLVIGAGNAYTRGQVWRSLIVASLALLIFNFTLHMFFYWHDMFLYALHWQVPMLFSLAGLISIRPGKFWGSLVLFSLAIISAASGIQFIIKVITTTVK